MKKIIILANNSNGLYIFRKDLMAKLVKLGNQVIAYTPFDTNIDDIQALNVDVREVEFDRRTINPIKDLSLLLEYRKIIKSERPDLVITYTIKPNVYGGIICGLMNIPYAINITGLGTAFQKEGFVNKIAVKLYKIACKKAKIVFFENIGNRDIFLEKNIVKLDKTHVLSGAGVDTGYFALEEYPDNEVTKFLFSGRIMKEKGIDELLIAMQRLLSDGENVELHVLGEYEEEYKSVIERCEADGWLHFHGYQSDVRPYIASCDCFVLPSWHEGMANTNLECASMGRPVITSNIHGCLEAVEDGVTGFLAEPKNADDLYRVMKKFLGLPINERKKMGLLGHERMVEIFDKKAVVEDTVKWLGHYNIG